MIIFETKDQLLEFTPLNNGKAQYAINYHDFGNLESLVERIISYDELNWLIERMKDGKYSMGYLK